MARGSLWPRWRKRVAVFQFPGGRCVKVYLLADLAAHGAELAELVAACPSVTAEALQDALTWARAFPRPTSPRSPAP